MDGNCILTLKEESVINLDEVEPMDIDIKSEIDENENNQEFSKFWSILSNFFRKKHVNIQTKLVNFFVHDLLR